MDRKTRKSEKLPYPYNLLAEVFESEERASEMVLDSDQQKGFDYAIGTLSDREREVIRMRFDECMTLEEVGKECHTTRERIRQIEAKALRKLRHPSRLRYIKDGYAIASGDLERQVMERHRAELEKLERWYKNKIKEIEAKLLAAKTPDDHILSANINTLGLSVRTYNALHRSGVDSVKGLLELTDEQLLKMRNIGAKSIAEVHQVQKRLTSGWSMT